MNHIYAFVLLSLIILCVQTHLHLGFIGQADASPDRKTCFMNICFPPGNEKLPAQRATINQSSVNPFSKWGDNEGDLSIVLLSNVSNGTGGSTFEIRGNTGNSSEGFIARDLNFADSPIRLDIVRADKISRDPVLNDTQVSFAFNVVGNDSETRLLRFVTGPLFLTGWEEDNYYQNVIGNSSNVIDFNQLLADHGGYAYLNDIVIAIQRQSTVNSLVFSLYD